MIFSPAGWTMWSGTIHFVDISIESICAVVVSIYHVYTVMLGLSTLELSRNRIYLTIMQFSYAHHLHVHKSASLIQQLVLSNKYFGYKLCRITQTWLYSAYCSRICLLYILYQWNLLIINTSKGRQNQCFIIIRGTYYWVWTCRVHRDRMRST
jgi:hypothetical protein